MCPNNGFLTSFKLKVQPSQGIIRDDTAVNDVMFTCSDNSQVSTANGGSNGYWDESAQNARMLVSVE